MSNDYSLEELGDITPFENYTAAIRAIVTRKKYDGQLEMFLNPNYKWNTQQQTRFHATETEFTIMVNDFVNLIRKDPNAGKNRIKRYVMKLKKQLDEHTLNPNTARNRLKPIKAMLRANEIDFSWYLIDRMMPRETKSSDRAYTRAEIQKMIGTGLASLAFYLYRPIAQDSILLQFLFVSIFIFDLIYTIGIYRKYKNSENLLKRF